MCHDPHPTISAEPGLTGTDLLAGDIAAPVRAGCTRLWWSMPATGSCLYHENAVGYMGLARSRSTALQFFRMRAREDMAEAGMTPVEWPPWNGPWEE